MSAGCVRWLLNYSTQAITRGSPVCWSLLSRSTRCKDRSSAFTFFTSRSTLCTAGEDTQPTTTPKKERGNNNTSLHNVGRQIHHPLLQVIGENGDDMGTVARSDVLKLMKTHGLKLVLLSENKDPPVYRLLSGRQLYEEKLKLREKQKAKPAPVQKEITLSSDIAPHDLSTKLKRVTIWLKKEHHVKVTLQCNQNSTDNTVANLESLVQKLEVDFGFLSKPVAIRNGQAVMCILRPPSDKELALKSKKTEEAESSSESSSTSPASTNDTTETTEISEVKS